jgi:hypothetical protein
MGGDRSGSNAPANRNLAAECSKSNGKVSRSVARKEDHHGEATNA